MEHSSGNKEASKSQSLATMMATEVKSNQRSRMTSSSRETSTLSLSSGPYSGPSSTVNPDSSNNDNGGGKNIGGSYQNHHPHHHLHIHDGPPKLHRRNSEGSNASSIMSKGNQENSFKINISHSRNNNNTHTIEQYKATNNVSSKKATKKNKNPLRVLGIALIVDQKGTGARMMARYPTSQASVKKDDDEDHENVDGCDEHEYDYENEDDGGNGDDRRRHGSGDDDLFFTLTARQMAKLFRTKRSLCNQPMTLRVNKTIFCCHAVLMEETNNSTQQNPFGQSNSTDDNSQKDNNLTAITNPSTPSSVVASEDGDKKDDGNDDGEEKEDNSLQLFSVVVALAPSMHESALPFSSFLDADSFGIGEDRSDLVRYIRHGGIQSKEHDRDKTSKKKSSSKSSILKSDRKSTNADGSEKNTSHPSNIIDNKKDSKRSRLKQKKKQKAARVSSAFLAIRRVHISLVRFCRALQREEIRCGYVTYQSSAFFQIRNERQKKWDEIRNRNPHQPSASPMTSTTNTGSGGVSVDRGSYPERGVGLVGGAQHHHTPRHSRQNSFMSTPGVGNNLLSENMLKTAFESNDMGGEHIFSIELEQEKEQEILELMLACNPQNNSRGQQQQLYRQNGNLVRDLVAIFHSLSRNDHEYPPTPSSLLCEQDAVVYVNQHFAIPIDAAGLKVHSKSSSFVQGIPSSRHHKKGGVPITEGGLSAVQPYYTLLFPHASPSELLQTFHASGSAPPQQMEHLLITVNPQKPLTQVAADANLPMHTTMQIASILISHGACIPSPVVSLRSRLTCFGSDSMQRIPELALDFSQTFPGVSLFGVVSFLTKSSRRLGDAMSILIDTENEEGTWLRESLLSSPKYRYNRSHGIGDVEKMGPTETSTIDQSISKSNKQNHFPDETNESSYSPTLQGPYISSRGGGPKQPSMAQEPTPMSVHEWFKDLEEVLFSIAVWLLSHRILVQLQEYMVAVAEVSLPYSMDMSGDVDNDLSSSMAFPPPSTAENERGTGGAPSVPAVASNTTVKNNTNDWDENLFKELLEMEYLKGDISIMALSWRMAIDPRKLRNWGLRHKRVRVISRVPSLGDDWEPATTTTPPQLLPVEPPTSSSPAAPAPTSAAAASVSSKAPT